MLPCLGALRRSVRMMKDYTTMVPVPVSRWMLTPRVANMGPRNPVVALVGGSALVLARPLNALPLG